ncbi:hypothetical protein JA1_002948 [Spathaspora sp. JA1]|nr:hypothetical protein JA1_002948 [Spathaspora sp. JA1]
MSKDLQDTLDKVSPPATTTNTGSTTSWLFGYIPSLQNHILLYSFVFLTVIFLIVFHFRDKLGRSIDRYRMRRRLSKGYYGPVGSFDEDMADGLTSDAFDIEQNIQTGDKRRGLTLSAKREIKRLMKSMKLSFDEARLRYTRLQFDQNDVDENGIPRDPKLVTF